MTEPRSVHKTKHGKVIHTANFKADWVDRIGHQEPLPYERIAGAMKRRETGQCYKLFWWRVKILLYNSVDGVYLTTVWPRESGRSFRVEASESEVGATSHALADGHFRDYWIPTDID